MSDLNYTYMHVYKNHLPHHTHIHTHTKEMGSFINRLNKLPIREPPPHTLTFVAVVK